MLEAVLFDWGETLVHFEWDDELLAAGHRAGLAVLGREGEAAAFTERFRCELLPALVPGDDYAATMRSALAVDAEQLDRFHDAEWESWTAAHALVGSAHAMLESLRERGFKLGVIASSWPEPPRLLRRRLEQLGIAQRVDAIVVVEEGPAASTFERALDELGVAGDDAIFVGDRLDRDVQVAANLGMTTVQALWFRADDTPGIEPDFMAFTPMDVVNVTRRLAR
ncbi:MAG TPA: HAD family hydrolase [Gaiellaceae bacterium]